MPVCRGSGSVRIRSNTAATPITPTSTPTSASSSRTCETPTLSSPACSISWRCGNSRCRGSLRTRCRQDPRLAAAGAETRMPKLIDRPTVIDCVGTKPKQIQEYAGRVNSGHSNVSVARMISPSGWEEPGQTPEFEEITVVLKGSLRVEHKGGVLDVKAGQAVVTSAGEWVRYSTPGPDGAEYVAVCLPAFSPATVHRDE